MPTPKRSAFFVFKRNFYPPPKIRIKTLARIEINF